MLWPLQGIASDTCARKMPASPPPSIAASRRQAASMFGSAMMMTGYVPTSSLRLPRAHDRGAGFAFGRYTRFDDETGRDIGVGYWPDLSCGSLVRHILEDAFVMQNAALIRRSALLAVGSFSECMQRSLDYDMFVRLACSFPATYVDMLVFDQRKHPGDRGPAAMLHRASASMEVWRAYDCSIFENLYRHAPLALFEAMFDTPSIELRTRAALLQRAVVMARHDCWELACEDFEAAANTAGHN